MSHRAAFACFLLSACAFGGEHMDASPADTGRRDMGPADAGATDADPRDAQPTDADPADAAPEDADPMDADPPDVPPSGPRVEVGGGSIQYEPLTSGQMIEFAAGPQGGGRYDGFHIWFGARTWELNPTDISATFIVLLKSDRSEQARLNWVTNFRPTAIDAFEIWGATPRLMDCCVAVAQDLIMRVEVVDADGKTAAGEIEVRGDDQCADMIMNYCP